MNLNTLIFCFIFVYLNACGQQGGSKGTKRQASDFVPVSGENFSTKTNSSGSPKAVKNDKKEGVQVEGATISTNIAAQLQGSWKSSCSPSDDISMIVKIEITDSKYIQKDEYFAGINCSQLMMSREEEFKIKLNEGVITNDNLVSFAIEQTSAEFSIERQEFINPVNKENWFGYSDWVATVPKNIAGKAISPDEEPKWENGTEGFANFMFADDKITIEDSDGENTVLNKI
ncbi:MAG: hypothetical protein AB8G05_14435 [Oligoflexales bacterium]